MALSEGTKKGRKRKRHGNNYFLNITMNTLTIAFLKKNRSSKSKKTDSFFINCQGVNIIQTGNRRKLIPFLCKTHFDQSLDFSWCF